MCGTTFSFEWNKELLDLASPEPKQTGIIYHSTSFRHLSTFPWNIMGPNCALFSQSAANALSHTQFQIRHPILTLFETSF